MASQPSRVRTASEEATLGQFFKIRKIHQAGVIVYWVCTVSMLVECFILFVKAVTPSGLAVPDEYQYLKSQEIILFVLASL